MNNNKCLYYKLILFRILKEHSNVINKNVKIPKIQTVFVI